MIAVLMAAMLHCSFTINPFGEASTDCKHSVRVPATWDSVRVVVEVFPNGAYYRHFTETFMRRRGDAVFWSAPAPILDNTLVRVRLQRKANHYPETWLEACPEKPPTIIVKPTP